MARTGPQQCSEAYGGLGVVADGSGRIDLDVLVQATIVDLLAELRRDLGLAMVFVTHNLPLVRSIADRVVVLADGRIVEQGLTADVIDRPQEEYTKKLLADTPRVSAAFAEG